MAVVPGDLTLGDVHTSLGHEAHPSLGLLTAEGAQVVDVRRLLCDLKVSDTAVPLHTHTTHTENTDTNMSDTNEAMPTLRLVFSVNLHFPHCCTFPQR